MPPKSKGQTIQLRDLQRMAYENGEIMEGILPTQSLGLERTDSHTSNRGGRMSSRYENDDKIAQMLETDWRKGREGGDLQRTSSRSGRDRFNRPDIEDMISNTNWRDDAGRSTEKPRPELDFRRGASRTYDNQVDPDSISFNWRDSSNSAQSGGGFSSFGSRFSRENSTRVHVDDRPDYLKNRFKKRTEVEGSVQSGGGHAGSSLAGDVSSSLSQKLNISEGRVSPSVSSSPLSGIVLGQNAKPQQPGSSQPASKSEKKPKQVKKVAVAKESKKIDESETNLSLWQVSDPAVLDDFEKELFKHLTGEAPREGSVPASCFEPNTYSPPGSDRMLGFISDFLDKSVPLEDSQSLSMIAKLSHVFTLFSSALRCIDDVILLSASLSPVFKHLIARNKAGEATAKLYVLIEIQRMAFAIGNPKIDNVTSILESLWISLLKSQIVTRDTFNLWLSKNDLLGEESKFGRKNALFEALDCPQATCELLLIFYLPKDDPAETQLERI
ncbi:Glycoprotein GP40/15, partial [Cryptosporidium canis]